MPASRLLLAIALSTALAACRSGTSTGSQSGDPPAGQGVTVEVRPARISVLPGDTVDFTSLVTGTADPSVTWEVTEKGGGTVSSTGTYVAPLSTGEYTVRASSTASPSAGGNAKVKVGHVAVAVSPTAATVPVNGSVAFTANVRGTKDSSVSWSVREPSGCGSIAPSGQYAAPAAAMICHVIATSVADPTAVAEGTATVTAQPAPAPPVVVTITPGSAAVDACQALAFTATVSGTSNGAVTWTVQEGSAGGAIAPTGVYTAPAAAGTYHVVATSQAAPTSSSAATLTVAERILGVALSPATATLAPGASAQFTATVTSTCGSFTAKSTVTAPN